MHTYAQKYTEIALESEDAPDLLLKFVLEKVPQFDNLFYLQACVHLHFLDWQCRECGWAKGALHVRRGSRPTAPKWVQEAFVSPRP